MAKVRDGVLTNTKKGHHAWHRIGRGTKKQNALARRIRKEVKRAGMPFQAGVDYAMREGCSREVAIFVTRMAYRIDAPHEVTAVYRGGLVNPR